MTRKRQYQMLLVCILGGFVLVMATGVRERWNETFSRYGEIRNREALSASPESLATRRSLLKSRSMNIRRDLDKEAGAYARTFAGFLALVSKTASSNQVKLTSVVPMVGPDEGDGTQQRFRIECRGEYHRIGLFLNPLENSPFDIHITKVELRRASPPAQALESTIEGRFLLGEEPHAQKASLNH